MHLKRGVVYQKRWILQEWLEKDLKRYTKESSREYGGLAHPQNEPHLAPSLTPQDVNETGSMIFCPCEGRPAWLEKVASPLLPHSKTLTRRVFSILVL